jgi:hypothetical protein
VIYTGLDGPNLRVVDVLDRENDDPEMHVTGSGNPSGHPRAGP